jgi:hypothetical protein
MPLLDEPMGSFILSQVGVRKDKSKVTPRLQAKLLEPARWPSMPAQTVARFFRYLSAWRHIVYNERTDDLERTYMPFSPESDIIRVGTFTPEEMDNCRKRLIAGVKRHLKQANYVEVPREEIGAMLDRGSQYGLELHVEMDDFEECILVRRGTDTSSVRRPSPWTLHLGRWTVEFPVHQRVLVLLANTLARRGFA